MGPLVETPPDEIIEIRARLEGLAARLAAEKMSLEAKQALAAELARLEDLDRPGAARDVVRDTAGAFHRSIRDGASNVFLKRFLGTLEPFDRTIKVRTAFDEREAVRDRREHREIIAAIEAGDSATAERVMYEHIHRVIARKLATVTSDGPEA